MRAQIEYDNNKDDTDYVGVKIRSAMAQRTSTRHNGRVLETRNRQFVYGGSFSVDVPLP